MIEAGKTYLTRSGHQVVVYKINGPCNLAYFDIPGREWEGVVYADCGRGNGWMGEDWDHDLVMEITGDEEPEMSVDYLYQRDEDI